MSAPADSRALSPGDVLRLLAARRLTVLGSALVCAAAALGLALVQRPKFEASATVLLDPSARGGLMGSLTMLAPLGASVTAPAEVAVLRSRGVVDSVVGAPEQGRAATPGSPGFDLHVGLTTEVTDETRTVLA